MRVMIVHGRYRHRGGEDRVVDTEMALLAARGVVVEPFLADNCTVEPGLGAALGAVWSPAHRRQMERRLEAFRPDVVHVHNTFPLISPSIFGAIRQRGIPVVQTLHNYRLLCANALLSRGGRPCEACLGHAFGWRGIWHRCYRDSHGASAVVAGINLVHRLLGTWARHVSAFVALSPFSRGRFVAGGLPAEKIHVRANPVQDPGPVAAAWDRPRRGVLYVGRLSGEKGILELMAAWQGLDIPLTVIGGGELAEQVRQMAPPSVRLTGWQSPEQVSAALSQAALVVAPSTCYENCPTSVIEAMAHGVPVIASDLGAMRDLVRHGETGVLTPTADPAALRKAVTELMAAPERLVTMGLAARALFEDAYAPGPAMDRLIDLYQRLAATA